MTRSLGIAVFGGSDPPPGDPGYEMARRVGALIAARGLPVVCGGYGGVMEGAARGAREVGGEAIGVTCSGFRDRAPNRFLSQAIPEPDLFSRTRRLIELALGFIILPGRSGTLAELAFLWALRRGGFGTGRPVVLLGDLWPAVLDALKAGRLLDHDSLADTRVAADPVEAVGLACAGSSLSPGRPEILT